MSENACVHCGADCGKNPVIYVRQKFCCSGCKQVYQLLNENQLYQYYTLQNTPGVRIEDQAHEGKRPQRA